MRKTSSKAARFCNKADTTSEHISDTFAAELNEAHKARTEIFLTMEKELREAERRYGGQTSFAESSSESNGKEAHKSDSVDRKKKLGPFPVDEALKVNLMRRLAIDRRKELEIAKALEEADWRSELHQERYKQLLMVRKKMQSDRRNARVEEASRAKGEQSKMYQDNTIRNIQMRKIDQEGRLEKLRADKVLKIQRSRALNESRRQGQLDRASAISDIKRMMDAMAGAKRTGDISRARCAAQEAADLAWRKTLASSRSFNALLSQKSFNKNDQHIQEAAVEPKRVRPDSSVKGKAAETYAGESAHVDEFKDEQEREIINVSPGFNPGFIHERFQQLYLLVNYAEQLLSTPGDPAGIEAHEVARLKEIEAMILSEATASERANKYSARGVWGFCSSLLNEGMPSIVGPDYDKNYWTEVAFVTDGDCGSACSDFTQDALPRQFYIIPPHKHLNMWARNLEERVAIHKEIVGYKNWTHLRMNPQFRDLGYCPAYAGEVDE
ncbi:hypothetical protein FOL47_007671 [Perkinsus chesapeaki]|uniref:Uncharacterized protein n=1 Tax=Perkinsus chesapeaki TaxID=330153 RepID=A0A7J6LJ17_PERCH|nr:hypothetical protein FOL47_007671 [Perkinsus chesapeaki]